MTPADVKDLPTLLAYVRYHEETIYVRAELDGKWGAYSLAELPATLWGAHVARFVEEGTLPVRVLDDE